MHVPTTWSFKSKGFLHTFVGLHTLVQFPYLALLRYLALPTLYTASLNYYMLT